MSEHAKPPIRILVVDDHLILRMGLVTLLTNSGETTVVGEAEDGQSAVNAALRLKPDVVIMDIMMPGLTGTEATERIKKAAPDIKILILTSFGTSNIISKALSNGADGVLLKNAPQNELLAAIKSVANGERTISEDVQEILRSDPPIQDLSPRQKEILDLIVRGFSNADIANRFGISVTVVKEHLTALYRKMSAANRAEAIAIAVRKHLLKI